MDIGPYIEDVSASVCIYWHILINEGHVRNLHEAAPQPESL
jgi:hypothetical protein